MYPSVGILLSSENKCTMEGVKPEEPQKYRLSEFFVSTRPGNLLDQSHSTDKEEIGGQLGAVMWHPRGVEVTHRNMRTFWGVIDTFIILTAVIALQDQLI